METLESLSDTLETTGDIQSIVRTMKSLSAVSIRQYEEAEQAMADYAGTIELGLAAVLGARRACGLPPPRTGRDDRGAQALVVIGSDRGLCGRYNETVTRAATQRIGAKTSRVGVIGARAAARIEAQGHKIDRVFLLPGSVVGMTDLVGRVLIAIDGWMQHHAVTTVSVVHNRREGRTRAAPRTRRVLPLAQDELARLAKAPWPGPGLPFTRMDRTRLLSWLVRQRLFVILYRALAEAQASEHATRLAAMQSAERNIEDRREDLMTAYRRKRQETITRELLDVISGFEAVGSNGE